MAICNFAPSALFWHSDLITLQKVADLPKDVIFMKHLLPGHQPHGQVLLCYIDNLQSSGTCMVMIELSKEIDY